MNKKEREKGRNPSLISTILSIFHRKHKRKSGNHLEI
jgi:hypothetical protein